MEALKPADAVIVAVAHEPYKKEGWRLIQRLLKDGAGLAFDVRGMLPRESKPEGVELWRSVSDQTVLVTGAAGFIGSHVTERLLAQGRNVVGVDNLTPYYDPRLQEARIKRFEGQSLFRFIKLDLADRAATAALFAAEKFPYVVHLAAQAGVRHSLKDPHAYVDANLQGFVNVLERCRHTAHESGLRLIVVGLRREHEAAVLDARKRRPSAQPLRRFEKGERVDGAILSHLFRLPATGLRFFTVYGPWGRPDMAMWIFADAITRGQPIGLFNHGKMRRDFTYVDDVVEFVARLIEKPAAPDPSWSGEQPNPGTSNAPWRVYNIGNNAPVDVPYVVSLLEKELGRKAKIEMLPMQPGDVPATYADVDDLMRDVGFRPSTSIEDGVARFIAWYRQYHKI